MGGGTKKFGGGRQFEKRVPAYIGYSGQLGGGEGNMGSLIFLRRAFTLIRCGWNSNFFAFKRKIFKPKRVNVKAGWTK
jgi:hypothetical protein